MILFCHGGGGTDGANRVIPVFDVSDWLNRAMIPFAMTNINRGVAIPFQYRSMLTVEQGILVLQVLFPIDK